MSQQEAMQVIRRVVYIRGLWKEPIYKFHLHGEVVYWTAAIWVGSEDKPVVIEGVQAQTMETAVIALAEKLQPLIDNHEICNIIMQNALEVASV